MKLKNDLLLYHGSYAKIEKIDLSKCVQGKDFGTGFYLTTDYEQAKKFIHTSVAKAIKSKIILENQNIGFINVFKFSKKADIKIFEFQNANKKWLHFVAANRQSGIFDEEIKKYQNFDIIFGKIANDLTNRIITAYINETYGKIGSDMADKTTINLLLPNKLKNQICFRTEKSISCLSFERAEEIKL